MNHQDSENLWKTDYLSNSEVYGESEHFIGESEYFIAWQISENVTLTDVYNSNLFIVYDTVL